MRLLLRLFGVRDESTVTADRCPTCGQSVTRGVRWHDLVARARDSYVYRDTPLEDFERVLDETGEISG